MVKPDTTLNDIAESIADLATMMADESQNVRQEMAGGFKEVDSRLKAFAMQVAEKTGIPYNPGQDLTPKPKLRS